MSKVAPKSLTGKIATLKTDLGELATEVNKKEGSAVMKRLKSIDLTVRGMEEQVGVPKA